MGTLERDNLPNLNEFENIDASPLAIIDRSKMWKMLGGD